MVRNEISISTWLTSQTNLASYRSEWSAYCVQMEISHNEGRLSTHCKFSSWKDVLPGQSFHLLSSILAVGKQRLDEFLPPWPVRHWCSWLKEARASSADTELQPQQTPLWDHQSRREEGCEELWLYQSIYRGPKAQVWQLDLPN